MGLGLILLVGVGCRSHKKAAPAAARQIRVPPISVPVTARACDGSPTLRVAVQPGDYIHVVAGQNARDAVLTLFDPTRRQLLLVDSLIAPGTSPQPAEEILWVADAAGELRIELTISSGLPGPCDINLIEKRRATAMDRRRALAEMELARGHALRRTQKAEMCRAGVSPYERAQSGFAKLGLPRRRAEALLGLGLLERLCLLDDKAALRVFTRAEGLFAGDPAFESRVRKHLGDLRRVLGDLDGAIGDYQQALELQGRLDDRVDQASLSSNLGFALQMRGRYDEAATSFDRALALWQPSDGSGEKAKVLLNLGQLHLELGEADEARDQFSASLELFRQAKDRANEAIALNALGLVAQDAGKPGASLQFLQEALILRSPGSRGRAVTLTTLGVAYRQLGRLEDARRVYGESLPIFRSLGDFREQARILGNLGLLEATAGHDAAALHDFDQALGLLQKLVDPLARAWTLEEKTWVLRRKGDLETARRLMEEALAAVERRRFNQTSYTTRADFFATRQDSYDFLIDLLMEQHRKNPAAARFAAAALKINERSLARSLLDGLAAAGTDFQRSSAAPELHAREHQLENEIEVLVSRQTRLTQEAATPEQLRLVDEELRHHWNELDRVRAGLRSGDPRYAALTQPKPWSAVEIQRRLLDHGTLLLEYRLGEKRSFLWAVTPESLSAFDLPGRAEIEDLTRQTHDLLAGSYSHRAELSAKPLLARLSQLLLGPVARLLPGKRLLVVGDGLLQSLSFAALPEPGGSEPLIAQHEIVSLPSVSVLGEIRKEVARRSPAPKTLWVLANPDFRGLFPPLKYSEEEAAAILEFAPAPDRFEVLGREASRTAVLRGSLHDYRFLHFATHGSFAAADPGGGQLVLSQVEPNGFLHLGDIYGLDLQADLVVLSACQSALGREVRGEGMMGMTRAFFYAGAERVLVSLWNVPDRPTVELMRHFYRGILVEHLSPASALRAAQNTIRHQEGWRAPYYWAGFTLHGEWRGECPR